jgi:hypothetical protein
MEARRAARGILSAAGALVLLLAPGAQARKPLVRDEMRNTRYCEIFTVDLAPSPVATVWNSLGLNSCPQAWWDGLDTRALAAEQGDDLALLNGPRSFIMDRAKAKDYGPVTTFAGKRMRDVAAIDLATVGLAPPPAFTDVRIDRRNTWTWDAGKKVFELVAPSGRVYAMQSYSRQIDPSLNYSGLPGLGPRLGLPAGWAYRVRRPSDDLVLITNGEATITQDALRNTYQRLPPGLTR